MAEKQKILGIIITSPYENRFYFSESAIGKSISSYDSKPYITQARNYLFNYYTNTISLNEVLQQAGAIFTDKAHAEIDLSPENLEKDKIIQLLK